MGTAGYLCSQPWPTFEDALVVGWPAWGGVGLLDLPGSGACWGREAGAGHGCGSEMHVLLGDAGTPRPGCPLHTLLVGWTPESSSVLALLPPHVCHVGPCGWGWTFPAGLCCSTHEQSLTRGTSRDPLLLGEGELSGHVCLLHGLPGASLMVATLPLFPACFPAPRPGRVCGCVCILAD